MIDPRTRVTFPPDTPAKAVHAPCGDNDFPCIWPIAEGRLEEVARKAALHPDAEPDELYVEIVGNYYQLDHVTVLRQSHS